MHHCTCGCGARWCVRADELLGIEGMHVLVVHREEQRLTLTVKTDETLAGCPSCGVVAVGPGAASTRRRTRRVSGSQSSSAGATGCGDVASRRA